MDNVTHALVGAAMAEVALPARPSPQLRRAFLVTGVVAASLPDVDLAYTWITEPPIGYMLHHRGHTHTWPGLVVLGLVVLGVHRLWPTLRELVAPVQRRLTTLIAVALASHLLLDAGNHYGTHLLYPLTSRWYYGDAVFIFEPWLWVMLGVTTALNASGRLSASALWVMTVALPTALLAVGLVGAVTVATFAIGGFALAFALARLRPARRGVVVLVGTAIVFIAMAGTSRHVKHIVRGALASMGAGAVVDIAATSNPGVPWCWSLVTLEHGGPQRMIARRGTLSLLPVWWPASRCVSDRLIAAAPGPASDVDALRWNREWAIDLTELSAVAQDCRGAAWLQFGRMPSVEDGQIVDLRFDNPLSANFTAMAVDEPGRRPCPAYLTSWEWPRADVLD